MYDLMEGEDVYWDNKTHATDLFTDRAIKIIERQVQNMFWFRQSTSIIKGWFTLRCESAATRNRQLCSVALRIIIKFSN